MNNLEKFLTARIAEEEAELHLTIAKTTNSAERIAAESLLDECSTRRWTLTFYSRVSRSPEPGASAAWATLTPILLRMASRWRTHPDYNPSWSTPDDVPETFAERMARQAAAARVDA